MCVSIRLSYKRERWNKRASEKRYARTCSASSGNARPNSCHFGRVRTEYKRVYYRYGYENSLFTDVFPSWFFFRTCTPCQHYRHTSLRSLATNLRNSKFKVFLGDMLPPLPKRIHT